jgi:hypothetical protein
MYLLPLLLALQSSTSMCNDLTGNAKQLCLTGYSEAGQAGSLKTENKTELPELTDENDAGEDDSEVWSEADEAGAEGAEAAVSAGEAAAAAGAAAAEIEIILEAYRKNWQLVAISSSKSHWFVKGEHLSSVSNTSKPIWIKSDYSRDKSTTARTAMSLTQFDCQNRQTKNFAYTSYTPDGSVLYSKKYPYSAWEYTVPDSVLESILDAICID